MIEYHADDYGLLPIQSRHIIDCYYNGALNGISIMPNSPYLAECMDAIKDVRKNLAVAVHINFVAGQPLTGKKAKKLTDKEGNFNISFVKLLLISYIPVVRVLYSRQIRREIRAQLETCAPYMNDGIFRIDGHVHYHMIPVVFDALMAEIKRAGIEVSYIRFPYEELKIYRKASEFIRGFTPINIVKALVMNALVKRNIGKHREALEAMKLENRLFMGIMLSGHMFYNNVKECLPYAEEIAMEKGISDMELLFHPGDVADEDEMFQLTAQSDIDFLSENSHNRVKEAEALVELGR